jgi:hypothetical protein
MTTRRDQDEGVVPEGAAQAGNFELIIYFIGKGSTNFDLALLACLHTENESLIDFFIQLGATNIDRAIRESRDIRSKSKNLEGSNRIVQYLKGKRLLPGYKSDFEDPIQWAEDTEEV